MVLKKSTTNQNKLLKLQKKTILKEREREDFQQKKLKT